MSLLTRTDKGGTDKGTEKGTDKGGGVVVWCEDRDIMRHHFRRRREAGHKIDDDNNLPLCLSRWHKQLQEQAR